MDFILDIAAFLLQALILLGVFLIAFAGVMAISQRRRGAGEEGSVEACSLNERFELQQEAIRSVAEDPVALKAREKHRKKEKKQTVKLMSPRKKGNEKKNNKNLYSSGPYWSHKNKRAILEIKKHLIQIQFQTIGLFV